MNPLALILVFASSLLHAGWNLLGRRHREDAISFFRKMLTLTTLLGLPFFLLGWICLGGFSPKVWGIAALSGLVNGFYYFSLGTGYRLSDFSVVYPLVRAIPVLLVGAWDFLRGEPPTPLAMAGLVLVFGGCLALAGREGLRNLRNFKHGLIWAVFGALATALFTALDKTASENMPPGVAHAGLYGFSLYLGAFLTLNLFLKMRGQSSPLKLRKTWHWPALGSLCDFGGYWLVLIAFQLTTRASYVYAFRQIGILIGVGAAMVLHEEERARPIRLPAAIAITAGLILIAWKG